MPTAAATRVRRSPEQLIVDLQKQIAAIKARAERKKVARVPSLRHIRAAVKSLDKATAASDDAVLRSALNEARATLSACLSMKGVLMPVVRVEREQPEVTRNGHLAPDDVLQYVRRNPGQRSEAISAAMGTDAITLRASMRKLIDNGNVRASGVARGMTYSAV